MRKCLKRPAITHYKAAAAEAAAAVAAKAKEKSKGKERAPPPMSKAQQSDAQQSRESRDATFSRSALEGPCPGSGSSVHFSSQRVGGSASSSHVAVTIVNFLWPIGLVHPPGYG